MMEVVVKKTKAINDLVSGYSPQKVEDEKKVISVGENRFVQLMEQYEIFRATEVGIDALLSGNYVLGESSYGPETSLTPAEIAGFLQAVESNDNEPSFMKGLFVGRLVQNSYNDGHNNFTFNTSYQTYNLCFLRGTKDNPVSITIAGDIGGWCGQKVEHTIWTVKGNVGDCFGEGAKKSTFVVFGDTYRHSCCNTFETEFTFHGEVGYGCGWHSKDSVFRTTNKMALKVLSRDVKRHNEIRFVNPDGTEKRIRRLKNLLPPWKRR